jgi:hypothetical protein
MWIEECEMSSRWRAVLRSVIDAAHTPAGATKVLTSSDSRIGTTSGVAEDGFAEQFLLAEYELVRELRSQVLGRTERLVAFVASLQTAEIALVGLLLSAESVSMSSIAGIVLASGFPILLASCNGFLRGIDAQIMNRRYTAALNAIRNYFVSQYPIIRSAVLMPTDATQLRPITVGAGSSVVVSNTGMLLILTAVQVAALVAAATWLVVSHLGKSSSTSGLMIIIASGVIAGGLVAFLQFFYMRKRLLTAWTQWLKTVRDMSPQRDFASPSRLP